MLNYGSKPCSDFGHVQAMDDKKRERERERFNKINLFCSRKRKIIEAKKYMFSIILVESGLPNHIHTKESLNQALDA